MEVRDKLKKNYKELLFYGVVALLFLFTRLYKIMKVPAGLNIDEINMGYNAWCLSNFGVDRYGVSFPVYFKNDGSGQSALFIYVVTLLSKVFGYSEFLLRFTAVLFGGVLLAFATLIAKKLLGSFGAKTMSIAITIMPFFIMSERWAFDCYAMLPMFTMTLYFILQMVDTGKKRYAILTGIGIALTMYSYVLAYYIVPVFIVLGIIYLIALKKFSFKNWSLAGVVSVILSSPLIYYVLCLYGVVPEIHTKFLSITRASAGRMGEFKTRPNFWPRFFGGIYELTSEDKYPYTSIEGYGVLYATPLYIMGQKIYLSQVLLIIALVILLVQLVRKKENSLCGLVLLYVVACLSQLIFLFDAIIYRCNAVYFGLAFLLVYLVDFLWKKQKVIASCIGVYFVCSFISLCTFYFSDRYLADSDGLLAFFDKDLIGVKEWIDENVDDEEVYVDELACYNTALELEYLFRVEPDKSLEDRGIHEGFDEAVNEDAIYVLKDLDAPSALYSGYRLSLGELINVNSELKEELESKNFSHTEVNGFLVYFKEGNIYGDKK